jgi:hypothetical protein
MCRLVNWIPAIWERCQARPLWFDIPPGQPMAWLRALSDRELALLVWSGQGKRKARWLAEARGLYD